LIEDLALLAPIRIRHDTIYRANFYAPRSCIMPHAFGAAFRLDHVDLFA
jgi:hypothetical protein